MTDLATTKRTELARRSGDGIDVALLWVRGGRRDETIVSVSDQREGTYFEIRAEPYLALDVYYHPFAYLDFSSVADPISRLAA